MHHPRKSGKTAEPTPRLPRDVIDNLRSLVRSPASTDGVSGPDLTTGIARIDAHLQGKAFRNEMHEIAGWCAIWLALRILATVFGPVLWVLPNRRTELPYGPAFACLGVPEDRLVFATCRDQKEALAVAEEALRERNLAAVCLDSFKPIDLTQSRRLQIAAEAGRTLGLVLADGERTGPACLPAARSRWRITPLTAQGPPTGSSRVRINLEHLRRGQPKQWIVESAHEPISVSELPATCDRSSSASSVTSG